VVDGRKMISAAPLPEERKRERERDPHIRCDSWHHATSPIMTVFLLDFITPFTHSSLKRKKSYLTRYFLIVTKQDSPKKELVTTSDHIFQFFFLSGIKHYSYLKPKKKTKKDVRTLSGGRTRRRNFSFNFFVW